MSDEALIKEFWKLDDTKPVVWFHGKSAEDRDKYLRFVDQRITKDNYNTLYGKIVQFDTILQPVFGNNTTLYRSIVNSLGVSKYYHERRDRTFLRSNFFKVKPNLSLGTNMYMYTKKNMNRVNISAADLDWFFPNKYSLKIGLSLERFRFNITPKVSDDLRNFLEPSRSLINSESGQAELNFVSTKGHLFSKIEGIEDAVEKLIKLGTDFYINESYFLYNKSNFIEKTFITAINKIISIYDFISYFNKKTKNDIFKIIDSEEFLKLLVKKNTLKNSLSFQSTNVSGEKPKLRD